MVTDGKVSYSGADLNNYSCTFVATHQRQSNTPILDVLVRMAQASDLHLNEHLPDLWCVEVKLHDLKVLVQSGENACFGLHCQLLYVRVIAAVDSVLDSQLWSVRLHWHADLLDLH